MRRVADSDSHNDQNNKQKRHTMTINLNLGCSLEAMKRMKDNSYDLAVVDPPFGIGNFVQTNNRGSAVTWNDHIPSVDYFKQLKRVSKNQIIFGANYYNCFTGKHGAIVWIKNQPMPNFSKAVIASCTLHKKIEVYNQTWTNFVAEGRTGIHPCEMPVDIYLWIYSKYTKPGMRILDTHLGSGSSAIAAHDCGLHFDGWEIDTEYHTAAVSRYNEHTIQLKLLT